ncbi:MAG: septation protein IspZ [Caulobacteraceae bacterium]|nr:septation protein IspZ [Caulobacteraceae bacterium]
MRGLFNAGKFFLSDLLSSLLFAGAFALTGSVYVATAVGVGVGLGQVIWMRARGRPIDAMQWMSLGLVLVFGSATLFTHNGLFIKIKPAIIYVVVGAFMLSPGWMTRYMPDTVQTHGADVVRVFGFIWSGLMFATAAATAFVAFHYDSKIYAAYLASFPIASKMALFGAQYAVTRVVVRRRITAKIAAGEPVTLPA